MIPSFPFVRIPYVIKRILKRNLRDSLHDEMFISQELSQDPALRILLSRYFAKKVPDQTIQGIYRYHGWDYLRKIILSLYIYRISYGRWPSSEISTPYIDTPFNWLEEELMNYSVLGAYRGSLLSFYLRLVEINLYIEHKVSSFKLIESCARSIEALSVLGIKGTEVDIASLQVWHLGEYFSWDVLLSKIKNKKNYRELMDEMSITYRKSMTNNIMTYMLSIGDEENFGLDKKV